MSTRKRKFEDANHEEQQRRENDDVGSTAKKLDINRKMSENISIRTLLRYHWKKNRTATEAVKKINAVEGEGTVDEKEARMWFDRFNEGDTSLKDRQMVWLPPEVWLRVLSWISRVELGLRGVPLACRLLHDMAHCVLHERTIESRGDNERSLRDLTIEYSNHKCELRVAGHSSNDSRELPKCPIPENIVRFGTIEIRGYFDDRAIQFLRSISRLFVDVKLDIGWSPRRESLVVQHILPLCASIQSMRCDMHFLLSIQTNFPALLAQCQILDSLGVEFHEDEFNNISALLVQWFSTGRADGRPKVAYLCFGSTVSMHQQLIRSVKSQFVDATAPSTFIVRIKFNPLFAERYGFNPAEHPPMQNSATGEQFSLQIDQRVNWDEVLITRCAQSMPQAVQQEWDQCNQKLIGEQWFPVEQKIRII